jgi:hypothetical protein
VLNSFDRGVLELLGPRFSQLFTGILSKDVSISQSGLLYRYIVFFVFGFVLLFTLVFFPNPVVIFFEFYVVPFLSLLLYPLFEKIYKLSHKEQLLDREVPLVSKKVNSKGNDLLLIMFYFFSQPNTVFLGRRLFSISFPPPPVPPQWRKHDSESASDTPYDPSAPRVTLSQKTAKAKARGLQLKDCIIQYHLVLDEAYEEIKACKQYMDTFLDVEYLFFFQSDVPSHFAVLWELESRIEEIESEERQRRYRLSGWDLEVTRTYEKDAKISFEAILLDRKVRPWLFPVYKQHTPYRVGRSPYSVVLASHWNYSVITNDPYDPARKGQGLDYLNTFHVTPFHYYWNSLAAYRFASGGTPGVKLDKYNIGVPGSEYETNMIVFAFPQFDLIFQHRSLIPYFARWWQYIYQIYARRWCLAYMDSYVRPRPDWEKFCEPKDAPRMDWDAYNSLPPLTRFLRNFFSHFDCLPLLVLHYILGFALYFLMYCPLYLIFQSGVFFYWFLTRFSLFYLGWAASYQKPRLYFLNRLIRDRAQSNSHLLRIEPLFNPGSEPNVSRFDIWLWDRIDVEYSFPYSERASTYFFNPVHERFYYEYYPAPSKDEGLFTYLFYDWNIKDLTHPFVTRRTLKYIISDPLSQLLRIPLNRFEAWLDKQDWANYVTVLYRSQAVLDYNVDTHFWLVYEKFSNDYYEYVKYQWGNEDDFIAEEKELEYLDLAAVCVAYFIYFFVFIFHIIFGPLLIALSYIEKRISIFYFATMNLVMGLYLCFYLSPIAPYYFFWTYCYPVYALRRDRFSNWVSTCFSWFENRYDDFFKGKGLPPPLVFSGFTLRFLNFFIFRPLEHLFRYFFFFFIYFVLTPLVILFGQEVRHTFYQFFSLAKTLKSPGMGLTGYALNGELISDHKALSGLYPSEDPVTFERYGSNPVPHRERGFASNPQDYFVEDNFQKFPTEFPFYPYSDPTYTTRDGYDNYAKFSFWSVFNYKFPRSRFYFLSDSQYEKNFNAVPRFSSSFFENIIYRFKARRQFFDFLYAPRKFLKPSNRFGSWVLGFFLLFLNIISLFIFRPLLYLFFNISYYLVFPGIFAYCLSCVDIYTVVSMSMQIFVPFWPGDVINHISGNHARVLFIVNSLWLFLPPFRHVFGDINRLTLFNTLLFFQWFLITQDPIFDTVFFDQFEQIPGSSRRNDGIFWWGFWPFKEFPPPQGDEPIGVGFFPAL